MVYIKHLIEKFNLSVVAVSETLLVLDVPLSFVAIDGFWVVCGDGSDAVRKHGCLYVSESCSYLLVEIDIPNIAGVLLLDMDVWVVYRHPSYTVDQEDSLIRFINEYCWKRDHHYWGF